MNWNHSDPAGAASGFAIIVNGTKEAEVGANARSATLTGLKAGTSYSVIVRAKYETDNADSVAASAITAQPSYGTVTSLSESEVQKQQFNLNWTFSGDLSAVKEFRIFRANGTLMGVKSIVGTTNQFLVQDRNNETVTIDIKPGTTYTVYVRTIFKDGFKKDSGTITVITKS